MHLSEFALAHLAHCGVGKYRHTDDMTRRLVGCDTAFAKFDHVLQGDNRARLEDQEGRPDSALTIISDADDGDFRDTGVID